VKQQDVQTARGGLSIRARLALAFSALVLMLVGMAGAGAWRLAALDQVAIADLRMVRLVGEWLSLTRSNAVRATVLTGTDDPNLQRILAPDLAATSKRITEVQNELDGLITDPAGRTLFDTVGERRKAYLATRQVVLARRKAGQAQEAQELLETSMLPALATYVDSIQAVADHFGGQADQNAASAHQSAVSGRRVLLAFCAAGVALALAFSVAIMRSITRPIAEAVRTARRVADGDLAVEIPAHRRDEMGQLLQALRDMAHGLREIAGDVTERARSVSGSSAQIAQGNGDLSQRTEQQATTLEEAASSMEQLTATVQQNAASAREASERAADASGVARRGGEVVRQVVDNMGAISASSRRIADIIGVIDGIAFQTNLLALNAAVEAARAGEQGRGFAVVATEVRNLAQRSAQAAREIKTLINDSVTQVAAGAKLVDGAGRTMEEAVAAVDAVSRLVTGIAAASQEQSAGIEQVNQAVAEMDRVVQHNAALVEEAAAATASLNAQADALLRTVSRFRLEAPGTPPPLPPAVPGQLSFA
jgi:methyl-accepting chemotaxis protein